MMLTSSGEESSKDPPGGTTCRWRAAGNRLGTASRSRLRDAASGCRGGGRDGRRGPGARHAPCARSGRPPVGGRGQNRARFPPPHQSPPAQRFRRLSSRTTEYSREDQTESSPPNAHPPSTHSVLENRGPATRRIQRWTGFSPRSVRSLASSHSATAIATTATTIIVNIATCQWEFRLIMVQSKAHLSAFTAPATDASL